jgi:hypothetical protein
MFQLREYQISIKNKAIQILRDYRIVYLAMEVRTGKTLTAFSIAEEMGFKKVLVVTKAKIIQSRTFDIDFKMGGFTFEFQQISFASLHKLSGKFDLIIIDEAHSIGGFNAGKPSVATKQLKAIVSTTPIILMSGTPSAESFTQLYYQFWVSAYSPFAQWESFHKWVKVFVDVKEIQLGLKTRFKDYSKAKKDLVWEQCKHLFLSVTQKEADFNSEVEEIVEFVEIDSRIYKFIEFLLKNERYVLKGEQGEVVLQSPADKQMKVHQAFSGTIIAVKDGKPNYVVLDESKAKYIFEKYGRERIAIYYLFKSEGEVLKKYFPNWTDNPDTFRTDNSKVFICQFQSGARGINLSVADRMIFYNIAFSSETYIQVKARLQSKDREKSQVVWIFAKGGIEEKIYNVVQKKQSYTNHYFIKDFISRSGNVRKQVAKENYTIFGS